MPNCLQIATILWNHNTSSQISVNVNLHGSSSTGYNRLAAVEYANRYAYKACDCGKWYGPTQNEAVTDPQLKLLIPSQLEAGNIGFGKAYGTDCAHFVSHCLAVGGLNNKDTAYARGWCQGGSRDYIITVREMRLWFNEAGLATNVSSVNQLEPGDVIITSNGNHIILYLGDNKYASHSRYGVATYKPNSQDEYWHIRLGSSQVLSPDMDTIQQGNDQQANQPPPENTSLLKAPTIDLQWVLELMAKIRGFFGSQ